MSTANPQVDGVREPAMGEQLPGLPPLPKGRPDPDSDGSPFDDSELFTNDQMHAYARQCVALQRPLLSRCLMVISTLEGDDTTEEEMLAELKRDLKQAMGIQPLIPGSLI